MGTGPLHFVKHIFSLTFCEAKPVQNSNSVELNPFALVQIFFLTGDPWVPYLIDLYAANSRPVYRTLALDTVCGCTEFIML